MILETLRVMSQAKLIMYTKQENLFRGQTAMPLLSRLIFNGVEVFPAQDSTSVVRSPHLGERHVLQRQGPLGELTHSRSRELGAGTRRSEREKVPS